MKRILIPLMLIPAISMAAVNHNEIEQFKRDVHLKDQLSIASVYACKAGVEERCVDAERELQELLLLKKQKDTLEAMERIDPSAFKSFLNEYYSIDSVVQNSNRFEPFRIVYNETKRIQKEEEQKLAQEKLALEEEAKAAKIAAANQAEAEKIQRHQKMDEKKIFDATLVKYGHIVFVMVCLLGYKIWGLKAFYGPYAYVTDHVKDIFDVGVTFKKASTSGYQRYRTSSIGRAKDNILEGITWVIFAYLLVTLMYVGIYYASIYSPVFIYNVFIN